MGLSSYRSAANQIEPETSLKAFRLPDRTIQRLGRFNLESLVLICHHAHQDAIGCSAIRLCSSISFEQAQLRYS